MNGAPDAALAARTIALRLVLATGAVLVLASVCARDAVGLMMPALSGVLAFVADDFKILQVDFFSDRGASSIGALAMLEHTIVLGGRAIVPDDVTVIAASTTLGTLLQPALVALVLVLAWPARWHELALRLAIVALPLAAVLLLLDTPLSLAAWLWQVQLRQYAPGTSSPLIWWNTFLNGGGRPVLGLIAGALAIALAQRVGPEGSGPTRPGVATA